MLSYKEVTMEGKQPKDPNSIQHVAIEDLSEDEEEESGLSCNETGMEDSADEDEDEEGEDEEEEDAEGVGAEASPRRNSLEMLEAEKAEKIKDPDTVDVEVGVSHNQEVLCYPLQ